MTKHEVPQDVFGGVCQLMNQHQAYYEVSPYYYVMEERTAGTAASNRRFLTGFDIDVYGTMKSLDIRSSHEYQLVSEQLTRVTKTIASHAGDSCSIEVVPFSSTAILDTKMHLQPMAMLRVTIRHNRGVAQPVGAAERYALKEVEQQLKHLGLGCRAEHFTQDWQQLLGGWRCSKS